MIKIAWKYIKGYKKNTMVCILGIAFSVMLVFSLVGISNRIMEQYQNMLLDNSSLHDVRIKNIDSEMLDVIYNEILPKDCKKFINQLCGIIYTDKVGVNTQVLAVEGDWEIFYKTQIKEGKRPENPYEICVEESYAKEYKTHIGDELSYELYDGADAMHMVTFKVVGIIDNIPSSSMDEYIFTGYNTSKDMIENIEYIVDGRNNSILVAFDLYKLNEDKEADLAASLIKKYGGKFYSEHMESNEDKVALLGDEGTYKDISVAFYGVCVVVFVCMIIFIYNAISINMTEKIRQYGVLRCIGINNKKLVRIMVVEQVFNALIGLGIGIVGGKLLNSIMADKIIGCFVKVGGYELTENLLTYIITFGVTFIAVFIAFMGMYRKVSKLKPLEMIRHMEASKEVKVKSVSKNLIFNMSNRNIKRNPSKSRVFMSTVFIASLLIILIGNAITSIDLNINKMAGGIADVEVISSLASEEAPYIEGDLIERVKVQEKVREVYCQRMENGYDILVDGKVSDTIHGILIYSDNLMEKFIEFNDVSDVELNEDIAVAVVENKSASISNISLRAKEEIYGYPNACKEYELAINDSVVLSLSNLMGSQFGIEPCVIINETLAEKIIGKIKDYTNIYVELNGTVDILDVKEMIGSDAYTYNDLKGTVVDAQNQMIGMVYMALYMMVAVIILNIFVIANIIKSNVSSRSREIGMLRSIGAERKWVEKSFVGEIIILTIKGMVAAALVAMPVSIYVYIMINETVGIGFGGYIIGIPVIVAGVYIISKMVLKKSMNLEITEIVRSE